MKKITILMLLLALVIGPVAAFAGEASPWTKENSYSAKALGKLDFGFKNALGGWTKIFTETASCMCCNGCEKAKAEGQCKFKPCPIRFGKGLIKGTALAAVDTVGGLLHIATFPVTALDVPLPEGGVQLS